jgi:hypothetical protein
MFDDYTDTEWGRAAEWLRDHGIVKGKGDNKFHGSDPLLRAEVAVMILRYINGPAYHPGGDYPDNWYSRAVALGYMSPVGGAPLDPATRNDCAVLLAAFAGQIA